MIEEEEPLEQQEPGLGGDTYHRVGGSLGNGHMLLVVVVVDIVHTHYYHPIQADVEEDIQGNHTEEEEHDDCCTDYIPAEEMNEADIPLVTKDRQCLEDRMLNRKYKLVVDLVQEIDVIFHKSLVHQLCC